MADPPATWPAEGVLALTKLQVPERRAGMVEREPLVRHLCADDAVRLTLISAPPGAGKTTLLAEWHAAPEERRRFAWLSLDADDRDPVRFWALIVEALRTVEPGFGTRTLAALRSLRSRFTDVIVPLLINEASELGAETVLVLDDLHMVDTPEIHEPLALLIDRLPARLRLAIATRLDPPLPLARLRVRGELCEIRGPDLRLSDAEADELLRRRFGVTLAPAELKGLQRRTEGWAAALQLAGLSLHRGRGAEALATGEADALEYLAGEVLTTQDEATRRFLVETAILDRLTPALCDAVTGRDDSAERLPELDRRNLMLVPLDAGRRWWRYHHLFADALRAELPPDRARQLHRRAAAWHAEHGLAADAIRHAVAAGEPRRAAELIADHWRDAFNRGELATVERWLNALPEGAVVADPRLWLAELWLLMDAGRLSEAGALLEDVRVEAAPDVLVWSLLLHALRAFKLGDVGAAEDGVARALECDPEDRFWRTVAALVRGLAGYARGRLAAGQAFEEAARLARADGNRLGLAYALGYRALIAVEAGLPAEAAPRLEALDELREDPGVAEHFVAFAGGLAHAALAEREGRYEAAAAELERAAQLAERGAGCGEIAHVKVALAQVHWARGRREDARRLAREARDGLAHAPDPGRVADLLSRLEQRTRVRQPALVGASSAEPLSDSELAVLRLLPAALSNRQIGEELYISVNTVKTHLKSIYAKLGSSSREQAVGRARELGLI
jgi:LuxR family transcriptional regulator, maltose regulon positive regulatory protein